MRGDSKRKNFSSNNAALLANVLSRDRQLQSCFSSDARLNVKNIRIHGHRTSVRLEPGMWGALHEIAKCEGRSIHDICSMAHDMKKEGASFTATLRVFIMEYYRAKK